MRIEIESAMKKAAREGIDSYIPVFNGVDLEVEACIPEVSLRNLRTMLKTGLKVASVTVVDDGHILVAFATGETYLATGFAVGPASDLTLGLSKFMASAFPKLSASDWEGVITVGHDEYFRGVIDHQCYIDLKIKETAGIKLFDHDE